MPERVTGNTQLITILAKPARHSRSPLMHNECFAKLGLDYIYTASEVEEDALGDAVKGLRAVKFRGANVSMPYKGAVVQYMDRLAPVSELSGAVNTIINDDGVLTGTNTDGVGFMAALKANGIDVIGKKIILGGAGGAATAILVQAALDGVAEIGVFNIKDSFYKATEKRLVDIAELTGCKIMMHDIADLDELRREIEDSVLFVNATSVGMAALEGKTYIPDPSYLSSELAVADVIYHPQETALLKMAKGVGCKTMGGLSMMLYQGAACFHLWTGHGMPLNVAREALGLGKS